MIEICPKQDCTACSACLNACAKGAICMLPDEIGCLYPEIDSKLCVDCGACEKACPNLNPPVYNYPEKAYVGCASDYQEQLTSTSGGIASVLSGAIINRGGVVYGSTSADPFDIHHIRVDKISEVSLLKGSKYVQSKIDNVYSLVKKDLIAKHDVMFIGTPCQVAGLKAFLHKDYPNLYTIDFVCHGVPPQHLFNDFLTKLLKGKKKLGITVDFRFRDNKGRTKYGLQIRDKDGNQIFHEVFPNNDYILGFLKGLYYRDNCYTCKYARPERTSDISLGDYRDANKQYMDMFHRSAGLSKILANTSKGIKLLDQLHEYLLLRPVFVEDVIKEGGQLVAPMDRHPHYNLFKTLYKEKGLDDVISEVILPIKRKTKRSMVIGKVIKIIYRIPFSRTFFNFIRNRK